MQGTLLTFWIDMWFGLPKSVTLVPKCIPWFQRMCLFVNKVFIHDDTSTKKCNVQMHTRSMWKDTTISPFRHMCSVIACLIFAGVRYLALHSLKFTNSPTHSSRFKSCHALSVEITWALHNHHMNQHKHIHIFSSSCRWSTTACRASYNTCSRILRVMRTLILRLHWSPRAYACRLVAGFLFFLLIFIFLMPPPITNTDLPSKPLTRELDLRWSNTIGSNTT